MKPRIPLAVTAALTLLALSACGGGDDASAADAAKAHGAINVWFSNNAQEVAWGKQAVAAWNTAHPTEMVTAQEIPAGQTSEAVISASITAGNAPCLIYNTSPAAVPNFQAQGGLVALDDFADGASYLSTRSGPSGDQYKSPDGKFYQMPWKSNPVMLFYNKKAFKKAGISTTAPPLGTYAEFLDTAKKVVAAKRGQVRHPAVAVEPVLPVLVRLLPDVRGGERRQAARRGQEGHLRLAGRPGGRRSLAADVRAEPGRQGGVHR